MEFSNQSFETRLIPITVLLNQIIFEKPKLILFNTDLANELNLKSK